MEPITTEFLTGVAFDINATHAGVATNASLAGHPNPQAEGASLPAIDPSTHASVSLPSGSVRMNSAAVSNLCVLASDGPPAYGDLLRPLTCTERQSFAERSPWRTHNERLPPARLVEVAHAALQSSGFRRRPASGAQPPLQNDLQPVQSASIAMAIDAERFGIVKRDVPGDNDGDLVTPHDAKRFRNESYGEATSETVGPYTEPGTFTVVEGGCMTAEQLISFFCKYALLNLDKDVAPMVMRQLLGQLAPVSNTANAKCTSTVLEARQLA